LSQRYANPCPGAVVEVVDADAPARTVSPTAESSAIAAITIRGHHVIDASLHRSTDATSTTLGRSPRPATEEEQNANQEKREQQRTRDPDEPFDPRGEPVE